LVVAALLSAVVTCTAIAFADETKPFGYGIEGNNLVFTTIEQATKGGSFRLAVKDGQKAKISVELVDIFSDESGTKKSIPLDSSPFTPKGLVQFKKSYPEYEPGEDFQYFEIALNFKEDVVLDRPVLGGLSISLVPLETQSTEQTVVRSSIVATFAYLPASGLNLEEYAPALALLGPTIERRTPDYFPLNLLPNLPFALNHGDLTVSYQLENTGKIFLETITQVKVEQLGFLGQPEGEVFTQSLDAFLVPGQQAQSTVEIAPTDRVNAQLGMGIYRFTTTATGDMGDLIQTSTANQKILLIFPWKQSFLAVMLLIVFRRRIAKGFAWLVGYAKALRDFRYGNDPTPTLTPKPNPEIARTQPTIQQTIQPTIQPTITPNPVTPTSPLAATSLPTTKNPIIRPPAAPITALPKAPRLSSGETRPLYPFWYKPPKKDGNS